MRALVRLLSLVAFVSFSGCGPAVDLTKGLQVTIVNTGWFDVGIVNGQNKLVPSVTFTLKNVSEKTLSTLQVNALFRRVSENDEWGSGFLTVAGSAGLAGCDHAAADRQVAARLHRQRSVPPGNAAEHPFRRREGGALREVRVDAVDAPRLVPHRAKADYEVV